MATVPHSARLGPKVIDLGNGKVEIRSVDSSITLDKRDYEMAEAIVKMMAPMPSTPFSTKQKRPRRCKDNE